MRGHSWIDEPLQFGGAPFNFTVPAGPINVAIATFWQLDNGENARFLHIATDLGFLLRPNNDGAEAASTLMHLPANSEIVLNITGYSHIRMGRHAGIFSECSMTPLANQ